MVEFIDINNDVEVEPALFLVLLKTFSRKSTLINVVEMAFVELTYNRNCPYNGLWRPFQFEVIYSTVPKKKDACRSGYEHCMWRMRKQILHGTANTLYSCPFVSFYTQYTIESSVTNDVKHSIHFQSPFPLHWIVFFCFPSSFWSSFQQCMNLE